MDDDDDDSPPPPKVKDIKPTTAHKPLPPPLVSPAVSTGSTTATTVAPVQAATVSSNNVVSFLMLMQSRLLIF